MFDATLDQLRALDALARTGTFAKAARALNKTHSAVVYALRNLEAQTELPLLDRSGYRTELTPAGERVLEQSRRVLEAHRALGELCHVVRTGWEPRLSVVFDGIYPSADILRHLRDAIGKRSPTRVEVHAEFLSGVEATFLRSNADLMISVLPPSSPRLVLHPLAPLTVELLAHKDHPLARAARVTDEELEEHVLLTVRGSDPRLALPTARIEPRSTVHLNDFHSKREAILDGMGYGWLPRYLARGDLRRGALKRVRWVQGNTYALAPHVAHLKGRALGRAGTTLVRGLVGRGEHAR
jgi:DNA-binding transcriptional LysR family regulator